MSVPEPIYFGPAHSPLFGWFHPAKSGQQIRSGLVICNPFGYEEICVHRSVLAFANAAAASGIPTLRFNYFGSGDSADSDPDADLLGQWVLSVHQAVDELKLRTGISRVNLLGIRLGATLAALAGAERTDISGYVAIAPVVQGRLYMRELKVLGNTSYPSAQQGVQPEAGIEAGGFVLRDETVRVLSKVDLRKLTSKPADRALLIKRDDMPESFDWSQELGRLGTLAQSVDWPGYSEMMATDPVYSKIPHQIVRDVIGTLHTWSDDQNRAISGDVQQIEKVPAQHKTVQMAPGVVETPVQLNTGRSTLFAVLTQPIQRDADAAPKQPSVGVIMINSGAVYHIGQSRMWVEFSRKWAAAGITCLRLDISGIGDSTLRPENEENVAYPTNALLDVEVGVKYLHGLIGNEECHLMGLCAGATHSFKYALIGQHLKSITLINPATFYWKRGIVFDLRVKANPADGSRSASKLKIFTWGPWRKLLTGKLDYRYLFRVLSLRLWTYIQPEVATLARMLRCPLNEDMVADIQKIHRSGTTMRVIFAQGEHGITLLRNYCGRKMAMLLNQGQMHVDYVENADHTFTSLDARKRLLKLLEGNTFNRSV